MSLSLLSRVQTEVVSAVYNLSEPTGRHDYARLE